MKVFITAGSGVGKTSVVEELIKRGYTAYDADNRDLNLARLEIKETGEPAEWPKGYVDWSYYSWNANEETLKELLETSDTVFVAGFLGNQEKLYHYFDKLLVLTIDSPEHERRLRARPKREFGDDEQNIQRKIEKYSSQMEKFAATGFDILDNSRPIEQTVNHILQTISKS